MEINGLPLHPLIVHAVVILVPLAAIGGIAISVLGWARRRYSELVVVGALGAMISTFVAQQAGEALLASLPQASPAAQYHASIGDGLFVWTILLFVGTLVVALAQRLINAKNPRGRVALIAGAAITVICGIVSVVQVVRIGDAGATAVWG